MARMMICAADGTEVNGVPEEIKILPFGAVRSQKGNFTVDDESFEAINKAFKSRKIDIVIDYEHQTLDNVQAPAAGWIKELRKSADAIIAKVEWTKKAEEYLRNKEYRYLSPVVMVRHRDNRAVALASSALTNIPAIDGMFPIVNSLDIDTFETELETELEDGGNRMELEKIVKILGLPEGATEEDVLKALESAGAAKPEEKALADKKEECATVANSTVLKLLGLGDEAKTEEVAATILALKAGDVKVQADLMALKARMEQRDADEAVQLALRAGKISAAQKDWATEYALKNLEGFKKFTELAPQTVPIGKTETVEAPEAAMGEGDILILKNLGLDDESIKMIVPGKEK